MQLEPRHSRVREPSASTIAQSPGNEYRTPSMVLKVAETICKRGPLALGNAIDSVIRGGDCSLAEGLAIEAELFGDTSATEDMREGMQAFLNKRPPDFQGR